MPTREEVLIEKTFKEEGVDTHRRVFYTLTAEENFASHRNSKLLASLVKLLEDRGVINDVDLDELLLECIY